MSGPRNTRKDAKTVQTAGLTNPGVEDSTEFTSLPCVSTAGRGAAFSEAALAFLEPAAGDWERAMLKKRHPAFAGRRAGDVVTSGVKKLKGVFGAGALLPQFLAELTDTLNSHNMRIELHGPRAFARLKYL